MADGQNLNVAIVQQGVWDMPLESMPLAAGYLKAMVMDDPRLSPRVCVDIHNFRGRVTHGQMARQLFAGRLPDVLAFSVFGWNLRAFGSLAETYKQLKPDGWVVFGGTHTDRQGERIFRQYPQVDVVVNGEGELTFRELVHARVDGVPRHELDSIPGISWQRPDGAPATSKPRPRIEDLDIIPSPFLTGAIDLVDENGKFRYDVALLETNRGCPYKCSFCYWGGAVGQRVRAFSRERLRAEIELFAKLGVHTIVVCDANFGMLPIDLEFVENLIEVKDQYGFPKAFEGSWAKNKSKVFRTIVDMMAEAGLRSSFTLALQSLSPDALESMHRRNMKVNDWRELVTWLNQRQLDCYAELIWGVPGETVESFLRGYDDLSEHLSRIAVYPIMLLPNTEYSEKKHLYGIVSLRGDADDFEYVLEHSTMSFADNAFMQRFLFWARVMAENAVLRHCWQPLRVLAGLRQSQVLLNLADWADNTDVPQAAPLREASAIAHGGGAPAYAATIGYLFTTADGRYTLERWWRDSIVPLLPAEHAGFLADVIRFDLLTQPHCGAGAGELPLTEHEGEQMFVRRDVTFRYNVPELLAALRRGEMVAPALNETRVDIFYRTGALNAVMSTNHEEIMHFMGQIAPSTGGHSRDSS